jgi:hypothetical protein
MEGYVRGYSTCAAPECVRVCCLAVRAALRGRNRLHGGVLCKYSWGTHMCRPRRAGVRASLLPGRAGSLAQTRSPARRSVVALGWYSRVLTRGTPGVVHPSYMSLDVGACTGPTPPGRALHERGASVYCF